MRSLFITALKQQLDKYALDLGIGGLAKLRLGHRKRCLHKRQQFVVARSFNANVDHSMHRHCAVVVKSPLTVPYEACKHAKDMVIGGQIKRFVGHLYGLLKELFMVHDSIMRGLGLTEHSYFPRGW